MKILYIMLYELTIILNFMILAAIRAEDIQRVARRMLQSPPSVAALGDLTHLPNYRYAS